MASTTITQDIQAFDTKLDAFLETETTIDFSAWKNRVNAICNNDAIIKAVIAIVTLCKWAIHLSNEAIESGQIVRGWFSAWWANGGEGFTYEAIDAAVNATVYSTDKVATTISFIVSGDFLTHEYVTADWWTAEQASEETIYVAEHPRHEGIQAWAKQLLASAKK